MKEVYLVKWSTGEYEDHVVHNKETVFLSLLSAEKVKKEIEEYYTTLPPFPLDSRDENNWYDETISEEDYNLADKWQDRKNENYYFNRVWIETLTLEE